MTVQSMTGFGKGEAENDKYVLSVELKTVNNRFRDYRFKMGTVFNSKEIILKKLLETKFSRGSFEVLVNYRKNVQLAKEVELDYGKIQGFIKSLVKVAEAEGATVSVTPTDFLRSDFYIEDESKEEELTALLEPAFAQAMDALFVSRSDEGTKLVETLTNHKEEYSKHYDQVVIEKEEYQSIVTKRLRDRFEKTEGINVTVDEPCFLQEVIFYLEKLDVDEEINRIRIHLDKLSSVLASGQSEIGRQVDFIIQELNRETNTIGSKSGNSVISENVVQMKVQLEKIREQALNMQ